MYRERSSSDRPKRAPVNRIFCTPCGLDSLIRASIRHSSKTDTTDIIGICSCGESVRFVPSLSSLGGGRKVTFKKVLQTFHLRNFLNATRDEILFLTMAYFEGTREAERLADGLGWACQRARDALGSKIKHMKSKPRTAEYKTFSAALQKVLSVSHSDMQRMLEAEKAAKKRKPRASASVRASGGKD